MALVQALGSEWGENFPGVLDRFIKFNADYNEDSRKKQFDRFKNEFQNLCHENEIVSQFTFDLLITIEANVINDAEVSSIEKHLGRNEGGLGDMHDLKKLLAGRAPASTSPYFDWDSKK